MFHIYQDVVLFFTVLVTAIVLIKLAHGVFTDFIDSAIAKYKNVVKFTLNLFCV